MKWELVGAYVIHNSAIITIQHETTKTILQISRPKSQVKDLIENGFTDQIVELVLRAHNLWEF